MQPCRPDARSSRPLDAEKVGADVNKFDSLRRERLLAFIEAGWPLIEAAAAADVSRQTVGVWLARGRHHPNSQAGEFATRFQAARAAANERRPAESPKQERPAQSTPVGFAAHADTIWRWVQEGDPFVTLSPEEMSVLTPEQRAQVVRMYQESSPPHTHA